MSTQGLRLPITQLVIAALIVLTIGVLVIGISVAWTLIHVPSGPSPVKVDPLQVVDILHAAINSHDTQATLAMFTQNATVDDSGSMIQGRKEIRNWVLHSQRMAGLHLTMIRSEIHADTITWIDLARNGAEEQQSYLLRWRAVIRDGKIQALTVGLLPMPDGK